MIAIERGILFQDCEHESVNVSEMNALRAIVRVVLPILIYEDKDHWPGVGSYWVAAASARRGSDHFAFPTTWDGKDLSPVGSGKIKVNHLVAREGARRVEGGRC
jgi:hypothetical protein